MNTHQAENITVEAGSALWVCTQYIRVRDLNQRHDEHMPSSSNPSCIMTAILQKEGLGLVGTLIIIKALRWLAIIVCNDRVEGACSSSCSTCYPAHK